MNTERPTIKIPTLTKHSYKKHNRLKENKMTKIDIIKPMALGKFSKNIGINEIKDTFSSFEKEYEVLHSICITNNSDYFDRFTKEYKLKFVITEITPVFDTFLSYGVLCTREHLRISYKISGEIDDYIHGSPSSLPRYTGKKTMLSKNGNETINFRELHGGVQLCMDNFSISIKPIELENIYRLKKPRF